jgi:hypothetical protein
MSSTLFNSLGYLEQLKDLELVEARISSDLADSPLATIRGVTGVVLDLLNRQTGEYTPDKENFVNCIVEFYILQTLEQINDVSIQKFLIHFTNLRSFIYIDLVIYFMLAKGYIDKKHQFLFETTLSGGYFTSITLPVPGTFAQNSNVMPIVSKWLVETSNQFLYKNINFLISNPNDYNVFISCDDGAAWYDVPSYNETTIECAEKYCIIIPINGSVQIVLNCTMIDMNHFQYRNDILAMLS